LKRIIPLVIMMFILMSTTGCTVFKRTLDKKTNFSEELEAVNRYIAENSWDKAGESMANCMEKWYKIKPWMQLELDHDVINEIEARLVEMSAYLETEEKSSALAGIRVIINYWKDIGSK
jgi:hypothetical protein